jgi:hypothetical protein
MEEKGGENSVLNARFHFDIAGTNATSVYQHASIISIINLYRRVLYFPGELRSTLVCYTFSWLRDITME